MRRFKKSPVESPVIRGYRELLGVAPGAGAEELKKSYRRLVQIYHPDKNPGGESHKQFLKVTEAYETLLDSDRVEKINQSYLEKKLYAFPIEGFNISFGSFFGYRTFTLQRVPKERRLGHEKSSEHDSEGRAFDLSRSDTHQSILDNPAYDSIELVYAGKFSLGDEERILKGFHPGALGQLPWIMLNNKGIFAFLEENFDEALACYEELTARIPNNIIFLYRLGLCHTILAFKKKRRGLLGRERPEPHHLKKAVESFRKAIAIGEKRTVGKQKCFTIRKILADVYERAGHPRLARQVWNEIRRLDPQSNEARLKLERKLFLLGRRKT